MYMSLLRPQEHFIYTTDIALSAGYIKLNKSDVHVHVHTCMLAMKLLLHTCVFTLPLCAGHVYSAVIITTTTASIGSSPPSSSPFFITFFTTTLTLFHVFVACTWYVCISVEVIVRTCKTIKL